jgi:hypothetical protein
MRKRVEGRATRNRKTRKARKDEGDLKAAAPSPIQARRDRGDVCIISM